VPGEELGHPRVGLAKMLDSEGALDRRELEIVESHPRSGIPTSQRSLKLQAGTMKRDMDLVRRILLELESRGFEELDSNALIGEGYDERTVAAHFQLLQEADLIEASLLDVEGEGVLGGSALRLTSEGHDYLDVIRNNEIWNKTKAYLTKQSGSVGLDMAKAVAMAYLKKKLALPD
jgi:hypothetical protein